MQSKQFTTVLSNLRLAKDALFDACLGHINTELQAQETVDTKIDILDLHRELLEQAGQAAIAMIAEHSLVIVQVRLMQLMFSTFAPLLLPLCVIRIS
jgi:hypothetical protein